MASKKIGIVIALDGEREFIQGVQNANKEANSLKSSMKNLTEEYDGNANSLDFLKKKQEILTRQQDAYTKKVDAAKDGLKKARDNYDAQTKRLSELSDELKIARENLEAFGKESGKESDQYKEQEKKVKDLTVAVERQTFARNREIGSISDWTKKINDAETDLRKINKATSKNEQYMREAESSIDKCAKSIDNYGSEVEKAIPVTQKLSDSIKDGFGEAIGGATFDLIKSGAGAVKDAMLNISDASSQLAASTGLSESAAARYKDVMQEIRGDNYGEDYRDVADAMREVIQIMGELPNDSMKDITESAITLRDTFGMDINESIRAADVMMKTMGVDSDQAFDLIAKGAQKGLNRSGELTDNITEYAQIWGQAGFSAEEMFAILDNGLNSGAYNLDKVNDYVKEFGNSLADGRIEKNLGSFSDKSKGLFAEWKNGEASTSEVFYSIIDDLSEMTNQQEALTLASEVWSALGEDNAMQVLTSLGNVNTEFQNVRGAMDALKDTKYDNLGSAISGLGAVVQENIVAPIADAALPAITTLVENVTTAISGIGDAASTPNDELTLLVNNAKSANEELAKAVENAKKTVENAELEAGKVEILGTQLLSLNGAEELSLSQKYRLKAIVDELGKSIPEIAAAYDEESGKVQLTDDKIRGLITSTKELIVLQATQSAGQEVMNNLINSEMALEQARQAQASAVDKTKLWRSQIALLKDLNESMVEGEMTREQYAAQMMSFWDKALNEGRISIEEYNAAISGVEYSKWGEQMSFAEKQVSTFGATAKDGSEAIKELSAESKEAEDAANAYTESAAKVTEKLTGQKEVNEELKESQEGLSGAIDNTRQEYDAFGNDITGMSTEQAAAVTEASQKIADAYTSMKDSIASSIEGSMSLFDEFSGGTEISTGDINKNLESQIEGISEWEGNMQTLAGQIGGSFSQELYDKIAQMGPEQSANMVKSLCAAMQDSPEEFAKVSENWAKLLELKESSDQIAQATSAGKAITQGIIDGATENVDEFGKLSEEAVSQIVAGFEEKEGAIGEAVSKALGVENTDSSTFKVLGENAVDAIASGIESGKEKISSAVKSSITPDGVGDLSGFDITGMTIADFLASGILSRADSVREAASDVVGAAAEEAGNRAHEFHDVGMEAASQYAGGFNAAVPVSAASSMAQRSVAGVRQWNGSFVSAGYNMAAGVASGISAGEALAVAASARMAEKALAEAKRRLDIHSPSRKFKKEVGEQIGKGMAFGIKDSASLAGAEAAKMSEEVYSEATAWLKKYRSGLKKGEKLTRKDVRWYWKQVTKYTKEGTDAYNSAVAKMSVASVSRTKVTGSGKKKKTVKKDAASYNSEIFNAASQFLENRKAINDWSLGEELSYWNSIQKQLKKGTKAWYDAQSKINQIKQNIGTVSNMSGLLEAYQTYFDMSEKAEMDYWDIVRQQYESGTDERIEADKKYLDAREKYTDKLKDLEEEYRKKVEDVNDKLKDSVDDLNNKYSEELKNRTDELKNAFGLFDEFTSESATGKELLFNIKAQAAGYEDWMQQIDELAGKGILSEELLDELVDQGPEISAAIHALNSLTSEELREYNEAYLKKAELSAKQAAEDMTDLRADVEQQTADLKSQAEKDKSDLAAEYQKNVASVNTNLDTQIKYLADNTRYIAEDQTAKLIAAIVQNLNYQNGAMPDGFGAADVNKNPSSGQAEFSAVGISALSNIISSVKNTQLEDEKKKADEEEKKEQNERIVSIINTGSKKKKLTSEERKKHHALYEYLVDKYNRAPSNEIYKKIAAELGVTVSKTPTSAQKTNILNVLKKRGLRSGGKIYEDGIAWMDEEFSSGGASEMIIRARDNAIMTRVKAGDHVINARSAQNLLKMSSIDPDDITSAAHYLRELNVGSGMASLNRLMEVGRMNAVSNNLKTERLLEKILDMMERYLPRMDDPIPAVVDLDRLVEKTYRKTGTELAMSARRQRR